MEIRIRADGAVVTESEFRALHPNTSLPSPLNEQVINALDADVVFEGPQAQPTMYQISYRDGVQQIAGKWYTKYSVADMDAGAIAIFDAERAAQLKAQRAEAYRTESDPLFFKAQRGEATLQEWLDKVAEIKARYPA